MRIPKFRIWSKLLNIYVTDLFLENLGVTDGFTLNELFENRNLVYQEFTGLYDRNGDEIYEGDILLFEIGEKEISLGGEHVVGVAVFTHGRFYLQDNVHDESLNDFCENGSEKTCLQIIGDIYRDKELLV